MEGQLEKGSRGGGGTTMASGGRSNLSETFGQIDRKVPRAKQPRPRILDGEYRLTENAFKKNLRTCRMFTDPNDPENSALADHRKKDENRAVEKVASEVAKFGSMKVAFHKTINFKREEAEKGPEGEVLYDRMKHFFKGPQHIITRETTKKKIRDLYRKDMDNIQEEIEQWAESSRPSLNFVPSA